MKEEMLAKLDAIHERMMAQMDSHLKKMKVCLGKTEAMDAEANPEETESEAEHQEVSKQEATMETYGALKKQYGDQNLAVRRRGQPKKRIQGNGVPRKKLAAAYKWITRCAGAVRRKGCVI
jgi:hypothetical protein